MLSCFPMDLPNGRTEFRLLADLTVMCDTHDTYTFERRLLLLHVFLVCALVGLGLPFYIFKTTSSLRQNNELSADSDIASLYELYRPTIPHFEAFLLLRKCLLLLSSPVLTGDSTVLQVSTRLVSVCCIARDRGSVSGNGRARRLANRSVNISSRKRGRAKLAVSNAL